MKNKIIFSFTLFFILIIFLCLTSCGYSGGRFKTIERHFDYVITVDTETNCEYVAGYGKCELIVNPDGTPYLYKGE